MTSARSRRSSSPTISIRRRPRSASARRWGGSARPLPRSSSKEVTRLPASDGATFGQLETRRTLAKTKRFRPGGEETKLAVQHRLIKLPKGAKPVTVPLTGYQEMCWRIMGPFVLARYKENQDLEDDLLRAHIRLRPEEYLAFAWMTITILAIGSAALPLIMSLLFLAGGFFFS